LAGRLTGGLETVRSVRNAVSGHRTGGFSHPACSIGELAVTTTERHPASRALVASFLFTDLVGYSKGTAAEQYAAKATLSSILRGNLATLPDVDYRIKDTGDGALIAFTSSPEHALYMALAIAEDFGRAAGEAGFPSNKLRTGLHLGSVKESIDLEARPNFVGDGINAAKRIMDFAEPGQITASRAFFDAVASLDSAYAELFRHVGAPDDKHGRAHELYAIAPSAAVLEKLKLDLAPAAHEPTEIPASRPVPIKPKQESASAVAADSPAKSSRAVEIVHKSFVPIIAVIALGVASVFVITKLTEPNVSRDPRATSEPTASPTTPKQAEAPPTSEKPVVDSQASPAIVAKPDAAREAVGQPTAAGPATPDSTQATVPTATVPKASVRSKPRNEASPGMPAATNTTSDRSSLRCSRIMEKASLGEALSTEEKRELAASCR
jgi:class 3 adenylate cyclase